MAELCHTANTALKFAMTFKVYDLILFSQKEEEEKNGSMGTNGQKQPLLFLSNWWNSLSEKGEGMQVDKSIKSVL